MTTSDRQMKAVLKLNGADRYRHFVKLAADEQKVWGLWQDGWALAEDAQGQRVFLLWPAKEYAELCAVGPLQGYEPEEIPVEDLLDQLLPQLARDQVGPGVFPLPHGPGLTPPITPPIAQLISDLESELERDGAEEDA